MQESYIWFIIPENDVKLIIHQILIITSFVFYKITIPLGLLIGSVETLLDKSSAIKTVLEKSH